MPRKTSESAVPAAETKKKTPSTAKKSTRSREAKTKATAEKKSTAKKTTTKKTATKKAETVKKPRAKKEPRPKTEGKAETVEAELVTDEPKRGGVGGNGNLIPLNQRSKEVQREIQEKGRQKNKENWGKRKAIREFLNDFLDADAAPILKTNMRRLDVAEDDMSNYAAMLVSLFAKAVNHADINAFRTIMEYAGRAPLQEMQENAAIAKMSQVMQLASQNNEEDDEEETDVVFYIPNNNRHIIVDDTAT